MQQVPSWSLPPCESSARRRGADVEIERRLGGSQLATLPRALSAAAIVSRTGEAVRKSFWPRASTTCGTKPTPKPKYDVPRVHPWRKPWKWTILRCEKADIPTLREHQADMGPVCWSYFAPAPCPVFPARSRHYSGRPGLCFRMNQMARPSFAHTIASAQSS
jgi:hypothetical protein